MIQWTNDASLYLSSLLGTGAVRLLPIVVVGLVANLLLRRASAAQRHQVWLAVVIAAIVVPVASEVAPTLVALPDFDQQYQVETQDRATENLLSPAAPKRSGDDPNFVSTPFEQKAEALHRSSTKRPVKAIQQPSAVNALSLEFWLVLAWALGALMIVAIPLRGQLRLNRRQANSLDPSESTANTVEAIRNQLDIQRKVDVYFSEEELMPMTWGVFRPVILLPASSANWSTSRLRMVLFHELAHVKRLDCLTQWITAIAAAMFWFHPAMWFALRRLCAEREQACDDTVLNAGHCGSDYATVLLDISTGCRRDVLAMCAGIAMSRSSRLQGRVQAILDQNRRRAAVSLPLSTATALIALLIGACIVVVGPISAQERKNQDKASTSNPNTNSTQPSESDSRIAQKKSGIIGFRLPDGTQIDVLGIGDNPADAKPARWWRLDGTTVNGSLFSGFNGFRNPRTDGFIFKQYAVRVTGRDPRAAARTRVFVVAADNSEGIRWRSAFQRNSDSDATSTHGFLATYTSTQDTATLSLAVARNDSIQKWPIVSANRKTASTVVQTKPVERTVISGPVGGDSHALVLPVVHNFTQHDVRIYAKLPNGKRIEADHVADTGSDTFRHATAEFKGIKLESIQNFELEIRPLIRLEIRNASMRAGVLTRPQLFGPWTPANGEGPVEGGMRYVDADKQAAGERQLRAIRDSQTQQRLTNILKGAPSDLTDEQRKAIELIARHECEVGFDANEAGRHTIRIELAIAPGDDGQAIEALRTFGEIEILQLSGNGLTDLHFEGLTKLDKLTALEIFDAPNVTGFVARSLQHFKGLEYLRITSEKFDDFDLKQTAALKSVKFLDLDGTSITDAGLQHLAGFPSLEHVDLSGTNLTGAGITVLRKLNSLKYLILDDTELTDAAISQLAAMPRLKALHIQGTTEVTSEAVLQLLSATNLEGLGLNDWHLSSEAIETITSKQTLKYLWLDGAGITDNTLAKLSPLNFGDLILNGPRITDDGVKNLAGMTNLKRLTINNCRIGDNALKHLDRLENLESLNITSTDVTDAGLSSLSRLPKLNYINAIRTSVTENGVKLLKAKRPQLTITYSH